MSPYEVLYAIRLLEAAATDGFKLSTKEQEFISKLKRKAEHEIKKQRDHIL